MRRSGFASSPYRNAQSGADSRSLVVNAADSNWTPVVLRTVAPPPASAISYAVSLSSRPGAGPSSTVNTRG